MIGLFDRDVFYKLTSCDLWEPVLDAFGITQPYRLHATSREGSNRRVMTRKLSGDILELALARISAKVIQVPVLSDELVFGVLETTEFQQLSETDGIDDGERILLSVLLKSPNDRLMITGDKRFVKSLEEHHPAYWNDVGASIFTFEQCILKIHSTKGFEFIRSRAFDTRECDDSLRLSFGDGANEAAFLAGISSFGR